MAKANKLIPVVDGTAGTPIDLIDSRIDISNPNDTDILVYDDVSGKFINQAPVDNNTIPTAQCTTAANIQNKIANCTDFTLKNPSYLVINIKNANSYSGKITLNVNSTGAKDVWIDGEESSSSNKTLPAGMYIAYYDGSKYLFRTDGKLPIAGGAFGGSYNDLTNTPSLATVATSGSYSDLTGKPTIGKVVRVCHLQQNGKLVEDKLNPVRTDEELYLVTFDSTTIPSQWIVCDGDTVVDYTVPDVPLSTFQKDDTCLFLGKYVTGTNPFTQQEQTSLILQLLFHSRWGAMIATKQDALPSLTNNAGKVLAVNNNETGMEWVNQSDTEDVFVCTYNSTNNTMSEQPQAIAAAHNNGKVIICKFNNGIYYCNIVSDSMIVFSLLKAGIAYNGSGTEVIGITEPTAQYIVYSYTTNTWNVSTSKILQEKLISGTNIKTINGNSILGSGDIDTSELPALTNAGDVLTVSSGAAGVEWATPSSGGATALNDLSDVSVTTAADGNILKYNASNSKFVNVSMIPSGTCNDSSATTKTVTITDVTSYYNGLFIRVKNGGTACNGTVTLNVNGLGAKPVYVNKAGNVVNIGSDWGASSTFLLCYSTLNTSSGRWDVYGRDFNNSVTPDELTGTDTAYYRMLMTPTTTYNTNGKPQTTENITANGAGTINAVKFKTKNGTSSDFVKGDGTLDNTQYAVYPSMTGNAGKVLAVNSGATGVEWVTQSSGGTAPKETMRVTCSTDTATQIKDVTISGYEPKDGDLISVYFSNNVGIGAKLRINSNVTCNILSLGMAIDAGIIKAGDTATFSIDRSSSPGKAYLLSIDRASVVAATMPAIPDELNDLYDVTLSNLSSTNDQVLAYTANGWRNIQLQNKRYGISFSLGNDGYTFSSINMMSSLTDTSFAVTVHELSNKILTACPIDVFLRITNDGSGISVVLYPSEEKYDNTSPYTGDHVCFCGFYYSGTSLIIYRVKGDNSTGSDVWTLEEIPIPVNPVTIYSGSSAPASALGSNGDIYIQTQS